MQFLKDCDSIIMRLGPNGVDPLKILQFIVQNLDYIQEKLFSSQQNRRYFCNDLLCIMSCLVEFDSDPSLTS